MSLRGQGDKGLRREMPSLTVTSTTASSASALVNRGALNRNSCPRLCSRGSMSRVMSARFPEIGQFITEKTVPSLLPRRTSISRHVWTQEGSLSQGAGPGTVAKRHRNVLESLRVISAPSGLPRSPRENLLTHRGGAGLLCAIRACTLVLMHAVPHLLRPEGIMQKGRTFGWATSIPT